MVADRDSTTLQFLAQHSNKTTKSGNVQHPLVRVRTLARLAEGIGLLNIKKKDGKVEITDLGREYYSKRAADKWSLSQAQKELLCDYILSDYYRTETIYAITSLFKLVKSGYTGRALAHQFAIEIGKEQAWKSEVTYKGFTEFGLNYINELGLLEIDDKSLLLKDMAKEVRYQENVNTVQPIKLPDGELPRPEPKKLGNSEKYTSNPRRSKNALIHAGFKCEINQTHTTFINKKSKQQYMEAHHLIPMQQQGKFENDIDVPENILCLCPNCHRKIHLADDASKKEMLKQVYEKKKDELPKRGIEISFNTLKRFYSMS